MKPLTVVIPHKPGTSFEKTLLPFSGSELVDRIVMVSQKPTVLKIPKGHVLVTRTLWSNVILRTILTGIRTNYLLLLLGHQPVSIEPIALERMLGKAESTNAGLVYSDFYSEGKDGRNLHPLNDYQFGSVRDDFDFGAMMLLSVSDVRKAKGKYRFLPNTQFSGLYDLLLKVSIDHSIVHLREPLYSVAGERGRIRKSPPQEKIFAYLAPGNEAVQREMEVVFTDYLKKIGAYLPPHSLKEIGPTEKTFSVEASVVIPVRNRKETIANAVKNALSQKTDFPFNVLVVDNHSTDGTTPILSDLSRQASNLKHVIPKRTDLCIGGCWNEALHNKACGRYAVQLDSDDLYSSPHSLQKMVHLLRQGNYAMVIGSYTLVNFKLKEIPPGLIDHREWKEENGHNNALRINGLGAPRAFHTSLMRKIGFLNVSYGEDYAAALRVSREYRIGRIYESLYLCRRWSGNTDAALTIEEANRNDAFKDRIRTIEILARQKMNQKRAMLSRFKK